jgi:hypothetical protein
VHNQMKDFRSEISSLIEQNKQLLASYTQIKSDSINQTMIIQQLTAELTQFRNWYTNQNPISSNTYSNPVAPTTFNSGLNFNPTTHNNNNFVPFQQQPFQPPFHPIFAPQQFPNSNVVHLIPTMPQYQPVSMPNNNQPDTQHNNVNYNTREREYSNKTHQLNETKKRDPILVTPLKDARTKLMNATESSSSIKEILTNNSISPIQHEIGTLSAEEDGNNNDQSSQENASSSSSKQPGNIQRASRSTSKKKNSKSQQHHVSNTNTQ